MAGPISTMAVHPTPVTLTVGAALIVLMGPAMVIPYNAHIFTVVPDQLMARVQSAMTLVSGALYPFAAVVTGLLVEWVLVPRTLMFLAVIFAVLLGMSLLPVLRLPHPAAVDTISLANEANSAGS